MADESKSFKITPEGTVSLNTMPDGSIVASSEKPVRVDMGTIDAIGLRNLADIEAHTITRVAGITSHFIRLFGGGEIVLAFNEKGTIIECKGENVLSNIINGRELVFSKKRV